MPKYIVNGKTYNIPDDKIEGFERKYPDANIEYNNEGKTYHIPISKRDGFLKQYPNAVAGTFTGQTEPQPMFSATATPFKQNNSVAPTPSEKPEEERVQLSFTTPQRPQLKSLQVEQKEYPTIAETTQKKMAEGVAQRQQLSDMTTNVQTALNRRGAELDEAQKANTQSYIPQGTAGSIPAFDAGRMYDPEYRDYAAAKESLQNAQAIIDAAGKEAEDKAKGHTGIGGFFKGALRGADESFGDINTWTAGLKDSSEGLALLKALDAAEEGTLTPSQQALLDAKAIELAVEQNYSSSLGRGYKAGQVTAESLPFMMEFAFNPIAGAGNTIANRFARYALNRFGKQAVRKNAGKYLAGKALSQVATDALKAGAITATTGAGRTTADALQRMQGDIYYQPNEEGKVAFWKREGGEDAATAFKKAYANTTIENFSEMLGNYFAPIGKAAGVGVSKGLSKVGLDNVNTFFRDVKANDLAQLVADFEKRAQWNGTIGEFGEEIAGGILNSIIVGDQTFDTQEGTGVFNKENLIDTYLGVALLGGGLSAAKTIDYPIYKYLSRKDIKNAQLDFDDAFGKNEEALKINEALTSDDPRIAGEALRNILGNDDFTQEQQETAAELATTVQKYKGAQLFYDKRQNDPETPIEEVEVAESYDNGRNLETPQEKNDAYNMYEYQAQNMRRIFGLDEDADVDAFIGDDPYSFATTRRNENLDDGQAVLDYLNAKATMDGLYDQVNDTIDQQIEQSNKIIDSRKNNDDAMIHPATMHLNDRKVYIISGRIKNLEDGTIDTANSDESIIIMDAETGNREFTTAADIKQADAPIDAEQEKMLAAETITNTIYDQAERDIEGVLPFNVGDPYTILDDQGVQHTVTIVADNGDGTVQMRMDNEQQNTTAKKDDVQAMFEAYNLNRLNTVVTAKKEQETKVAESSIAPTSEQAVEQVEPKPRIPLDEQGEPMYEAAPVYDTWTELLELNEGNEEEAIDTANTMRENAQAELDKAMEAPKVKGKTVLEIQAAKAQQKALIKQAQDKLNYWTDVANYRDAQLELMKRAEQRVTIAKAQAASQEKGRYSEENTALGAPIDFRDYVMRSIATGGVRFIWKDSETGTRGLGSHTGLKSNEERNARIWLLNNENGLYPEEAAEQLLTSYAEELGYTPNIDTSDALSEILDVVSSYATPSSMFEAAQVRHAEINEQNIEQEAEDAQARVLMPIAESLGLSLDEYLAWEEMMLAETLPAFEADYEQITAIFVEAAQQEEILNQNNDERSTENADVQSGVHSEGRLSDGSQAGVGVLQGEQMDNGISDSRGAEAGQGSDAQVVEPSTNDTPASEVSGGNTNADKQRGRTDDGSVGALENEAPQVGAFGEIYTQFKGKAKEAITFLLAKRSGEAIGALHHKDVGDIDLVWGKEGTAHSDGYGLAKLAKYHPEVLFNLQELLDDMVVTARSENRVQLESEKYKAAIRLTWDNAKKTWLLTMFEKKNSALSNTTDTDKTLSSIENDTATPENAVSSESKDTTSEPQKQDVEQKNDDHRIVFDAFGKDYISQDGKNSFRITQINGAKRVANVNVNTEAVGADNLEMTFEEVANLLRNGQWTEATSTPQQVEGVDIVTIKKDKHTKTGEDLFVAKIKDRVSRDEYNRIKGVAKEYNGYYSTAKRGFIFKTESDAEAFRVATQVPSAQMEDAKEVSLTELREVGSATNDIVEPIPTSDTEPQWKYELTVYDNGSTILERSRVMPNGVPVYDANFDMRAANPREMLDILNNPSNNMQAVLEQVGSRLEQRATVWDFREKARTEGVNGYKIGDTVKYTYNGKQEVGTIYDFEDYGDHNPILDLGTAPVLYVSAQWDQVEKVNEQPAVEQPKPSTPSGNKLVTDERYEELKRKMRQKLGGQMNMGIDPEILAIGTEMAVYHIEKGARKFADYASAMITDLGDMIRPYLKAFYNGARELPEIESAGYAAEMTTYDDVRTFDVSNFDKTAPSAMATAEVVIKEQEVSQQAEVAKDKIKNNRNKARKTRNKSVSSSEVMDLFGTIEQTNTQEDDLRGDDAVRTEGLPADGSGQPLGLRESERGDRQGIGQESGRLDGGGERSGSVQARTLSSGLLENPKNTRNNHTERGAVIAPSSVDARIEANIRAIELSQQLIANEQEATPEQMAVLRQFSGWGGLGKAFNNSTRATRMLQDLLGAEAYQDAVMSANSAYYTPTYIVDTLWDIATQLGFKGGNILEGSAGIGNILGQMPADISQRSDIRAIEIDSTAGNILSLLYPDAQVDIQGFEQTHIPNGSIDLAITNVPFVTGLRVNDTSGDKDLSKKFHNIHDFCIAKNVRKLREGGIGIFITSNGTLDNSKKLREWVTNQGGADFIGAFRLNNKTFGGTSVTSDIVVVRKRVNGQVSPNAIDVTDVSGERTAEYNTGETRKVKGVETPIIKSLAMDYNKYFIDRPENMAGVMRFGFEEGDTYRPTSKGLYPIAGKDQSQMLQEFVQSFTPEAFTARHENGIQEDVDIAQLLDGKKLGEVFVDADKLYIADADGVHLLDVNSNKVKGHTKVECFNAYVAIKDAVKDVLDYQTQNAGDDGLQPLLDKLNMAYDSFVKTYGHFNKNTAIAFLRNDVDYPNVFSLEKYEEIGDGKGGRIQKYEKSDVFKKRVIEKEVEPRPSNIKDGIIASIFKYGRVDVPYIAEQLQQSEADVKNGIIDSGYGFENPATREVEVSFQYLSGNIREKLRQAEDNNDDGQYNSNIKALKDIMPLDIPAHLIDFTLGSSWINPQLYDQYVKDRTDIDVTFTSAGGTWFMDAPQWGLNKEKNRAMGVVSTMLHKTIMGHTLIEAAMQNKTITVSQTSKKWDGSTETITDKEATQACAAKIDEIRQDFKEWARQKMQSDPDMSAQMERVYNDTFNNYVPMSIPADFVPKYFGGASHKWEMRPHQGKAIVRGTMQPLLLAHEVGTGKTFTLISIAMEMRRLGTARKPMVVVQNATVGQFVESAKALYPNTKILTLEEGDRSADGRKNFYAKIKYNDWDMIVVPQSTFEFIPDSEERQMAYIQDKIDEKMMVLQQMKSADANGNSLITRQAEKEIDELETQLAILTNQSSQKRTAAEEKKRAIALQNAEVKASEMLDRRTDDVENFDDMGIDALLIDEAHEYKHLGFATAMQRGVKGVDPSYSKKSQGVYLKTQAVLEKNNGRNVIFATGTPISNTAAEIWTFMRYLMPADTMVDYGIYYFDDFVRNFGNIQQMLEFTTSGKFKESNRFAGYVNLPELIRIWSGVSDTVLTKEAEDVSDKIPEIEGGKAQDIYLPQTRALRSIMKFVKAQLEAFDKMSGKQKKENSHIPLTMYGIAKAAAVDARLVQADAEDDANSKTNEAVRQTLRSLNDTRDYRGTIAIFADNYQNKQSGFNIYEDIRAKLIDQGVSPNEIVVIKPGMTIKKKLEIFDKVNKGEIRVILGSTFTLGTGVNIQERLHTVIHLDAPNRPMDYTQRNGRILRQGNLHKDMNIPVRVLRFGVEDSLDVTAYQRLKTKGAIADSIMGGKQMMANSMINRVLEEEEDVFGDTVAQLSGSEYAMLKNNAEKNVRKYESRRKQWEADQTYIHNAKPRLERKIADADQSIKEQQGYLDDVQKEYKDGKFKSIVIGKNTFNSVDDMAEFIKEYNKTILDEQKQLKDGALSGSQTRLLPIKIDGYTFDVTTTIEKETNQSGGQLFSEVHRKMSYSCPALGLENIPVKQALLRNAIEDITENVITGKDNKENIEALENITKNSRAELKEMQAREGKPFEFDEELAKAKAQYVEYSELMKKEMEEKEAKYADMDASVEAVQSLAEAEEDGEYRDRVVSYKQQFADLQSEYDALDKDDTEALNEWREKKTSVVRDYLSRIKDRFGMHSELIVFNGANEEQMREAYEQLVALYEANGNMNPPTYEAFKEKSLNPDVVGVYRKGGNAITFNATVDALNDKMQFAETMFHENAHRVSYSLYTTDEFKTIWDDAKKSKGRITKVVNELYGDRTDVTKGKEYIAKAVGYLANKQKDSFVQFLKGEMLVEELLKKLHSKSKIANLAVEETLNAIKDEYRVQVSRRGDTRGMGRVGYGGSVQDPRVVLQGDGRTEQGRRADNTERGLRGRILTAATDLAASLGVKLNVVDAIPNAPKGVKGRYSISTDQVYFVLPNATSVEDAVQTVLHEVVAHKGLRDVVGRDHFEEFLGKVFRATDTDTRRKIVALAAQNGWNFNVATEEYLASLAEEGFDSRENRTFFEKVRDLFMDMLRAAKIVLGFNINDNDMRYMLWRTYQMQRSNGIMAVAEDVVMQRKLGVGNFRARDLNPKELLNRINEYEKSFDNAHQIVAYRYAIRETFHRKDTFDFIDNRIERLKKSGENGALLQWLQEERKNRDFASKARDKARELESYLISKGWTSAYTSPATSYTDNGTSTYLTMETPQGVKETFRISDHPLYGIRSLEEISVPINTNVAEFMEQDYPIVKDNQHRGVVNFRNRSMTEREQIIANAKANGTYLKAPNGKDTNLTPEQWVTVRTDAFKKWFGDWEKAARIEKLRKSKDAKITGDEIEISEDLKQYRKNAQEYGKSLRGEYVNTDTGNYIILNKDSLKEVLHHDGSNIAHIQSVAAIPQMIENGIYITSESVEADASKRMRNAEAVHYYVCGLKIGNTPYTVKFVIAEYANGERYYDHSLTQIEKGDLLNRAELSSTVAESKSPISGIKDKRLISILQTNSSKIVDANGEPKVVEHSTWNDDFYTFDIEHLGESSGDEGVYGAGFYFGNVGETAIYGYRAIQTYLNMRNPIVLPNAPIMGFYDYLVKNFDKEGLRDIVVKGEGKTTSMGDVVDAIKVVNKAHARGEYADLIEQMSQYWSTPEEMVLEQKIFRKIGFAIYGALQPFIEYNLGRKEFSEALRNAGYDGVVYNSKEYVAFNPNQIKSATDNVGTFDSNNDDIRYRVAPSTPSTGEARQLYDDAVRRYTKKNNVKKTENLWHHLREAYQDSMLSVKKLMDAVLAETGNKLRGADDVYRAENQLSSKNKAEIEKWERDFMKPLQLEILDLVKKGASYEDIVEYLLAKHGLERNLEFSRREAEEDGKAWDGFVKRDFSGLTELTGEAEHFTEAAQQIVEEFEGKYNTDNLWSKINAATKESLKKSYDSGLMSKETYDKVANMFQYYIPLRGWDNNVAAGQYEYMANKGMKILPALKTAKGRTSRADDPIATLGSVGESSIIQGNRNLMKQKFLNFAQNNPTSLLTISEQWYEQNADGTWRPSNPEIPEEASADEVDALIKEHEAKMEALGDKATKKRQGLNINLHTTKWEQEEHAVNVKRNGKEYKIFVNGNPVAAQAINGFTNPDAKDGEMKNAAMWVKNFMARAFTSMNPAFVFSNLARDLIWAGTSVAIKENAAYARQYSKNISKAMTTAQLPRLVSKWKKGTLDINNPIEKYFHEFVTNGGETGFTQLNTVDDYKRNMERFIKEAQGGVTTKAKKGWRWIWDNVEFLNRSAEDTTRFMVYLTSRQMGRPIIESVANAKDITVNFNKKGRGGFGATYMNFAYIFFNATIQSLANFGKLIANHPKKTAAALTTFGASGMIAPMTALAMQAMLSGDDDEPTYWDLPEWVRRNNIVIHVGGSGYVTIPLPHELRPFYGMGELAFSTLMGKEEPDTALAKAAAGFASLMPFDYTGNAGNAAVNFTPTIAQPIAQLIVNKDYFGTPIYRKTEFNKLDPEWTKAYKSTNQLLVGATEFLNELTGGDEAKNGLIDLNPAIIEHLYEGYLGGMGKTINRAAKTLSMLWDEDARTWRNVPVFSSFYNEADERTSGSQVNREYFAATDEADEVEHLYSRYKKRAKMGSMEYAEKLNELVNSEVFKRYQKVNSYKKAITKLNEALKQADATDREQIETLMMELKVDMLEELEQLNNR